MMGIGGVYKEGRKGSWRGRRETKRVRPGSRSRAKGELEVSLGLSMWRSLLNPHLEPFWWWFGGRSERSGEWIGEKAEDGNSVCEGEDSDMGSREGF